MKEILNILPKHIQKSLQLSIQNKWDKVQEIRLRLNRPIEINEEKQVKWLDSTIFTQQDSMYMLNQLSEHSLYRLEDELREGYITIRGGHRVGIAGEVNTVNGKMKQIQHIAFYNIRIAKEIPNVAKRMLHHLSHRDGYYNTLIIGPPQTGKTTLIRDMSRLISDGFHENISRKVAIIDERSEIAAAVNGIPQHNIGKRTDVMDACPKVEGMMMMIRSMSPEVLIVDEIGKVEDVHALMEAIYAGVTIICTIHGQSLKELYHRPSVKILFENKVFSRYVTLYKTNDNYFRYHLSDQNGMKIINELM